MSQYRRRSNAPRSNYPARRRSYRQRPVQRATLCLLFRSNRQQYRHRRGMLGPFLEWLLGIAPARQNYRQYRYYAPRKGPAASSTTPRAIPRGTGRGTPRASTRSTPRGTVREVPPGYVGPTGQPGESGQQPLNQSRNQPVEQAGQGLTLAERHAAKYRPSAQPPYGQQTGPTYEPSPAPTAPSYPAASYATPSRTTPTMPRAPRQPYQGQQQQTGQPRRFHQARPSGAGVQSSMVHTSTGNQHFAPLPRPTGQPPYHLSLDNVLPADQVAAIRKSGRILLHVAGDTGGVKAPEAQQIVALAMETQFNFPDITLRPAFFYHLGDVVYFFGEATEYFPQFYDAYVHYPAPIFAIPGNHDGDTADPSGPPSLDSFVRNFCAASPQVTHEAGEIERDAMTQPNVYWTLEAPFVTIVGLYSNVPEGGRLDQDQIDWFVNELRTAPQDKALIVCVHHPVYSADGHHSGSRYIEQVLDNAFNQSGRVPDMVFSGHVHNYQRFTRDVSGRHIPYIVAGAGGYWHLHYMAKNADGSPLAVPMKMPDSDTTLENYSDNRHGFMRLMITPTLITGEYWTTSQPHESWRAQPNRQDGFVLDWHQHKLVKGTTLR